MQLNQQPPNNSAPTTPRVDRCSSSQRDNNALEHNVCTELHINGTRTSAESNPSQTPCLALKPVVAMLSQRLDASLPISSYHESDETEEQHLLRRRTAAASSDPIVIQVSPCELAGNLLLLLLVSFAGYCRPRNFYHNQIVDKDTKTLHTKLVNSYVLGIDFAFFCVCPAQCGIINNYLWVSFRWQGCGSRMFLAADCRSWQRLSSRLYRVDSIS